MRTPQGAIDNRGTPAECRRQQPGHPTVCCVLSMDHDGPHAVDGQTAWFDSTSRVWVRWQEFGGWTPWREATAVTTHDSWLRVDWPDGDQDIVPDHIIRGRVEIRRHAPNLDEEKP